jgi:glycosyltransferase involved in cell wall biosynthesis
MATCSIIIPSLHAPTVAATIRSLHKQTARGAIGEILVVGLDGPGVVAEDELVRFVSTEVPASSPRARNIGMRRARHEWLALIDADCVAEPDWLERLLGRAEAGEQVIGGALTFGDEGYWTLTDNLSMFAEFLPQHPAGPRPMLPSYGMLLHRSVYASVGPMDERLPRAHDIDWTLRMRQAGYSLYFEPQAIVWHHPPRGTRYAVMRHWFVSGYDMAIVRRKYASAFGGSWLLGHQLAALGLAPYLALLTTTRAYRRAAGHPQRRYDLLPGMFLSKLAWCLGASQSLRTLRADPQRWA